MNKKYLTYSTAVFSAVGIALPFYYFSQFSTFSRHFWTLCIAAIFPVVLGASLFFYKLSFGIKKPERALIFWTVWISYGFIIFNAVLWNTNAPIVGSMAAIAAVQIANVSLAVGLPIKKLGYFALYVALVVLCLFAQYAVLAAYLAAT